MKLYLGKSIPEYRLVDKNHLSIVFSVGDFYIPNLVPEIWSLELSRRPFPCIDLGKLFDELENP